jgi:hypothetical protein
MAFTGAYVPSDVAAWIRDVWQPEIGIAAYEEMRIGNNFKKLPAPEGKVHYRKHKNLTRNTLASTGDYAASLSPSGNEETEVTGLPQTSYVYVRTSMQTIARMMNNPVDIFRKSIEMSIAEGIDVACGVKTTDLTQLVGSSADNISEALLQDAIVKAARSMKSEFNPGSSDLIFCIAPEQIDDILSISNWTSAQIRGDGENPVVKGMIVRANGVKFIETGNIATTGGNTFNNPIFVPNVTFGIGYNQEPTVKVEEYLLEKRIVGWVDFALITCWDNYGVNFKTTTAA